MTQKVWNHVLDKYKLGDKLDLTPQKQNGIYLFGESKSGKSFLVFDHSIGFTKIDKKEIFNSLWLRKEFEKWKITKTVSGCTQLWEDWISYESNKIKPSKILLGNDSSTTKLVEVDCPECAWTDHPGRYIGAFTDEVCNKCGGSAIATQAVPYSKSNFEIKKSDNGKSKAFSKSYGAWGTDYMDYIYHSQDHDQDEDVWF